MMNDECTTCGHDTDIHWRSVIDTMPPIYGDMQCRECDDGSPAEAAWNEMARTPDFVIVVGTGLEATKDDEVRVHQSVVDAVRELERVIKFFRIGDDTVTAKRLAKAKELLGDRYNKHYKEDSR